MKKKKFFIVVLLFVSLMSFSQKVDRLALVIGNSKYIHINSLSNPERDANLIAETLEKLDFTVVLKHNIRTRSEFRKLQYEFSDLKDSLNPSVVFVYYAGHGLEVFGENYLLPTDIIIPEKGKKERRLELIKDESFSLNDLKRKVSFNNC